MHIVESVLGNIAQETWKARLATASVDWLSLDQWEAQKNRLRKKTLGGSEVAVSLDRATHLQDGDVLVWDEDQAAAIVAQIQLKDVMVVRVGTGQATEQLVRTCIELGHAIGNQHWPAVVKGSQVFVPLAVDKRVMASVMKTHAFRDVSYHFVPGSELIPYLAPHEQRRLFGSPDHPVHSHNHAHEHEHEDGHEQAGGR
jgi:urease accessory protein